jgi:hypothetical protein
MSLLFALVPGAACAPAVAMPRSGGDHRGRFGIRLMEAPVVRRHDPRARTGIVDHLRPGITIKRRVEVDNVSPKALHVELYAAAATIARHRFAFAPGRTPNELTTWVSLDRPAVDVPPYGKRTARVIIRVPPTASRGERYGVVWAEAGDPPDAEHNVGVVNRVGIPIYLDVGPGGEPPSDMRIEQLTPARPKDGPQILAQVRNTGGRTLSMSGTLSLSDGPGGLRAGPYEAASGVTLLPGDSAPVVFTMDKRLPNGPWTAHLTLQSGMVRRTVTTRVTFPDAGSGRPIRLAFAKRGFLIPLMAAGLAAMGVLFVLRRRRSKPGRRG